MCLWLLAVLRMRFVLMRLIHILTVMIDMMCKKWAIGVEYAGTLSLEEK